ncbi:MAG TPA: exodeoxyribonuclease III [Gammaproteobacteria bacterium]|nr:exodeoxyribonuclease III [Gammaproteobacteria bacterium]
MKIVSLNANGIRAAARKGFFTWMQKEAPDVVCIQETKAQEHQLTDELYRPAGYQAFFHDAQKKGYSGVAIYARQKPDEVVMGLGWPDFDAEGRWIEARFGKLSVISLYLPSGSSGDVRQQIKFAVMDKLMPHLRSLRRKKRDYIICGDWNIAHTKLDIKNWRGNQKNSGFLPEERAWLDTLFGPAGFVDGFRVIDSRDEQYTWWSNRGQAWAKNVGWRIDYQVITPGLRDKVKNASIYTAERFSDHAPLTLEYDWQV